MRSERTFLPPLGWGELQIDSGGVAAFRAWEGEGRPALGPAGSGGASREAFMARAAEEVAAAGVGPLATELGMGHLVDLGDLPSPSGAAAEAAAAAAEEAAAAAAREAEEAAAAAAREVEEAEAAALAAAERAAGALRRAEAELVEAEASAEALAQEAASAGARVEVLRREFAAAREASQEAEEVVRAARAGRLVEVVAGVEEAALPSAPDAGALNGAEAPAAAEAGVLNGAEAPAAEAGVNGAERPGAALPLDDSGWRQELRLWLPDDPELAEGPADLASAPAPAAAAAAAAPAADPPPPPASSADPGGGAVEFTLATPSVSGAPASALAVTVAADPPVFEFACDAATDVTLHWAVAKEQGGRWRRVPRGWKTLPDFSIDAGGNAWETPFVRVPPALRGDGPAQTMRLELAPGGQRKVAGVVFVLKVGDAGTYLNNGGDDFFVPLT